MVVVVSIDVVVCSVVVVSVVVVVDVVGTASGGSMLHPSSI